MQSFHIVRVHIGTGQSSRPVVRLERDDCNRLVSSSIGVGKFTLIAHASSGCQDRLLGDGVLDRWVQAGPLIRRLTVLPTDRGERDGRGLGSEAFHRTVIHGGGNETDGGSDQEPSIGPLGSG